MSQDNSPTNLSDFDVSLAHLGWPARHLGWPARHCVQKAHCGIYPPIFLHTQMTTQSGSLIYVRVDSSHDRAYEDISGLIDHLQQF